MSQAMPAHGHDSVDITEQARQGFISMYDERVARGIDTYGVPLSTHNGRDAVQDAEEELVDAWRYLNQIKSEREDDRREIERLAALAGAYRDQAEAWQRIWELCRSLGMEMGQPSGLDCVETFITRMHRAAMLEAIRSQPPKPLVIWAST